MKKLVTLALLVVTTFSLFAQDSHVSILLNSVNSRLNYGGLNSELKGHKKDVRGFQAGLSWQAGIAKHFSIVTEAYYVKKGGSLRADNPVDGMKSTLKLHTVEMPVLARVHFGKFYVNAGPYVNRIFSGKSWSDMEETHSILFGDSGFRRWETGFQGGAGYQFKMKKTSLALDVRYTHGLTSISNVSDLYNRTININLLVRRSWKH